MLDIARVQRPAWLLAIPVESGTALLCGLLLTFLGPFYTSRAAIAPRLVYWVGLSLAWVLISRLVELTLALSTTLRGFARWQQTALVLAIGSAPMTVLTAMATRRLEGDPFSNGELVLLYAQVALICAGLSFVNGLILERASRHPTGEGLADAPRPARGEPIAAAPASQAESPAGVRLMLRLPPAQRGRLRCLAGEDHYVRVYTDRGAPLVLMRLRDAIEELDGVPGERVHRSWWVALTEPCTFRRDGRKAVLELADDIVIPVSTPYVAAAEALASRDC